MEILQGNNNALKEKIYGPISVEQQPLELQIEICRNELRISPREWDEYENEIKGRAIASFIIKNRLETLEHAYRILEDK